MPPLQRSAIIVASLITACAAIAQEPSEQTCASQISTPDVNQCLGQLLGNRDAALATLLGRLVEKWEARDANEPMVNVVPAFMLAHRAWVDFRSRECAARAYTYGIGTGGPAEELRCSIEMTDQRITYLKKNW